VRFFRRDTSFFKSNRFNLRKLEIVSLLKKCENIKYTIIFVTFGNAVTQRHKLCVEALVFLYFFCRKGLSRKEDRISVFVKCLPIRIPCLFWRSILVLLNLILSFSDSSLDHSELKSKSIPLHGLCLVHT